MFSDLAAWHSALLYFAVTVLLSAWLVTCLPPLALVWNAVSWATQVPRSGSICGEIPLPRNSAVALLKPSCEAEDAASDWISASPACDCAEVTEMPLSAATWSMMENLISQVRTARGCSAAVSVIWLPSGLEACCRFETCWSSDELVIRWLPTIAAEPACTGEHAEMSAQAPRPAAPSASTRLVFLAATALPITALPNTGVPFQHIYDS